MHRPRDDGSDMPFPIGDEEPDKIIAAAGLNCAKRAPDRSEGSVQLPQAEGLDRVDQNTMPGEDRIDTNINAAATVCGGVNVGAGSDAV
jgi:hypothetical protein